MPHGPGGDSEARRPAAVPARPGGGWGGAPPAAAAPFPRPVPPRPGSPARGGAHTGGLVPLRSGEKFAAVTICYRVDVNVNGG